MKLMTTQKEFADHLAKRFGMSDEQARRHESNDKLRRWLDDIFIPWANSGLGYLQLARKVRK
jgi:TorA maturation chaperone TorD